MKNRGISFLGIIVFVGLVFFIAWGLNYIITKDFTVTQTSKAEVKKEVPPEPVATSTQSTPVIQEKVVATTTPVKIVQQTNSDLTVTLSDKGFSPAILTVKKGQTVTFINNSSGKMWVAANLFPSSSEYPTFNQKVGVDKGETWDFTFNTIGTWFYHSHYKPAIGAKIVVSAK